MLVLLDWVVQSMLRPGSKTNGEGRKGIDQIKRGEEKERRQSFTKNSSGRSIMVDDSREMKNMKMERKSAGKAVEGRRRPGGMNREECEETDE